MLYNAPSVTCQHCEMTFRTNSPFEESLFQVLPVTRDTYVKKNSLYAIVIEQLACQSVCFTLTKLNSAW